VKDASATPYNGQRINSPTSANKTQVTPSGKLCRAVSIVQNTTAAQIDSIRSGVSPATIGNAGTISLWYKSNSAWVGTDNALFDATNAANKWFYLAKLANGTLRLKVPDNTSATIVLTATSSVQNIPAGTWTHIAVTWDLSIPSASTVQIFVNGTLVGSYTGASNGSIRTALTSVIDLGDLRSSTYNDLGSTPYSADGLLDEVHFYSRALNATEIATDRDITRSCAAPDHFTLTHDGTGINCQAEQVKITAHLADHTTANGYVGTINLTASTNHGDWSISDAYGSLNNGTANDGKATFTFVSPDQGDVILNFKDTYAETVTIGVADGVITESSGVTTSAEHLPLTFASAGFQFQADGVGNTIGPQIAGKYSNLAPGAQTLTLQAIKTNDQTDACEAALVGSQTISLAAECVSPTTCQGAVFSITGDSEVSLASNASGAVSVLPSSRISAGKNSCAVAKPATHG
jgi:MSHA biogenesis protein MshQ